MHAGSLSSWLTGIFIVSVFCSPCDFSCKKRSVCVYVCVCVCVCACVSVDCSLCRALKPAVLNFCLPPLEATVITQTLLSYSRHHGLCLILWHTMLLQLLLPLALANQSLLVDIIVRTPERESCYKLKFENVGVLQNIALSFDER